MAAMRKSFWDWRQNLGPMRDRTLHLLSRCFFEAYRRVETARLGSLEKRQSSQTATAHIDTSSHPVEISASDGLQMPEEYDRTAEAFSRVAHELKAPLTAIIFSAELLGMLQLLDTSRDSHKEALIQNISDNASKVNRRITDLLDFIKARNGGLELEPRSIEIGPLISQAVSHSVVLFSKKRQSLKLDVPDSLPKVRADGARLQQVLGNLLEHASETSPDDSSITVSARRVGTGVVVEVKDSAPAISEWLKAKLFDPGYCGDGANGGHGFPALGPGLALSKRLVELHQGEIWVSSGGGNGNILAYSVPALE